MKVAQKSDKAIEVARQALRAALALLETVDRPRADPDSDPWVRAVAYTKAIVPARIVNAACASGQVRGAVKRGRSWIARRSDLDAWIEAGRREVRDVDDAEDLVAEWTR